MKYINPFKVIAELRAENAELRGALKTANDQAEKFEREWYMRGDEVEQLKAELAEAENETKQWFERSNFLYTEIDKLRTELAAVTEGWNAGQKQIEQLRAELHTIDAAIGPTKDQQTLAERVLEIKAKLAEVKQDAERLEWLIGSGAVVLGPEKESGRYFLYWNTSNRITDEYLTPREAIDAAIKEKDNG